MSNRVVRNYLCWYEGDQEEEYFEHIATLISQNYPNVAVCFKKIGKLH